MRKLASVTLVFVMFLLPFCAFAQQASKLDPNTYLSYELPDSGRKVVFRSGDVRAIIPNVIVVDGLGRLPIPEGIYQELLDRLELLLKPEKIISADKSESK